MRICISCFFLVILGQSNSLTGPDIVDTWEWIQGTRLAGNVLAFENQNKITVKPPKGGAGDAGGLQIAKPPAFSDTEIVGGSVVNGKGSSANSKANLPGINLYEIIILKAKQKGSGWSRVPFKKGIYSGYIGKPSQIHGHVDEKTGLIGIEDASVDIKFDNLRLLQAGGVSEMTGSCTYKIELWKIGKKESEKYEEKDVPVKFIASRRPAQPGPSVVDNKPILPSAQNESLINKSAIDLINQALSESKGNIADAEAIVQKMRRASQEASDNPALIRAQYWLKGRNGATIFGETTASFLGYAYISAKEWDIGFDTFTAWYERLPWNPAPYDPATLEWYNNGIQNILPAK